MFPRHSDGPCLQFTASECGSTLDRQRSVKILGEGEGEGEEFTGQTLLTFQ
jgi:hypothetical protein